MRRPEKMKTQLTKRPRKTAKLLQRGKLEITFFEIIPDVWISCDARRALIIN